MDYLYLYYLGLAEFLQDDQNLITSLSNSGQNRLTKLYLYKCPNWWTVESAARKLTSFIQGQERLTHLYLYENKFSDAVTAQLFSALSNSQCIGTIQYVNMNYSTNFSTDHSCQ